MTSLERADRWARVAERTLQDASRAGRITPGAAAATAAMLAIFWTLRPSSPEPAPAAPDVELRAP